MSTCLCCAKNAPVTPQKVCPICEQAFKGKGWWGVDAHWKARHEAEMPYSTFWAGLCEPHRGVEAERGAIPNSLPTDAEPIEDAYTKALSQRSSHVENILTHALIAKIAQELWSRDPWLDLQVFTSDVDDSGFDLVLGCKGVMRYIQIKQTHLQGKAVKYSLRLDFARMVGACAIVLVYQAGTLEIDHCLYFGGVSSETLPFIEDHKVSQSPGRRGADGVRKLRENYRDVPRRAFQGPLSIAELTDKLFN